MHRALVFILSIVFIYVLFFSTKNSIFEFSWKNKSFLSLIIAKELLLQVLLGVLLIQIFPLHIFSFFHVTFDTQKIASVSILYGIIVLILSLIILSKKTFKKCLKPTISAVSHDTRYISKERKILFIVMCFLLLLLTLLHGMGVKHAFIASIIDGYDLLDIRMANRYLSGIPTIFMSYLKFLTLFSAAFLGVVYKVLSRVRRTVYLFVIAYASLLFGAKGPLVESLIVFYLAYLSQLHDVPLRKILIKVIPFCFLFVLLIFCLVRVQYSGMSFSMFGNYLLNRVGVGQVQGVYEEFGVKLSNIDYVWHAVPFAKYLTNLKVEKFNKDLMMSTFGVRGIDETEIGVMNSLFIGEAFAIGGMPLVLLSPIIVAFNYIIVIVSLVLLFKHVFHIPFERSRFVLQVFVPSFIAFTGDLEGVLLFKINIMILIFILPIVIAYLVFFRFNRK